MIAELEGDVKVILGSEQDQTQIVSLFEKCFFQTNEIWKSLKAEDDNIRQLIRIKILNALMDKLFITFRKNDRIIAVNAYCDVKHILKIPPLIKEHLE